MSTPEVLSRSDKWISSCCSCKWPRKRCYEENVNIAKLNGKTINNWYVNYKRHGHQKDIFDVIDELRKERRPTINKSRIFSLTCNGCSGTRQDSLAYWWNVPYKLKEYRWCLGQNLQYPYRWCLIQKLKYP